MKGGCQVSKGNLAQCNEVCCHNRNPRGCRLEPESKMLEKIQKALTIRSGTIRELLAEALGMFILMVRRRWAQMCMSVHVLVCVCAGHVRRCLQQQFVRSAVCYHILRVAQQLVATAHPSALLEWQLPIG